MGSVFVLTNIKLENIVFPDNPNDEIILIYRKATETEIVRLIKNFRCRAFVEKKEVVNFFNIKQKVQIVKAKSVKLKPYDKLLVIDGNKEYIIIEPVNVKIYYKLIKMIKK